MRAMKKSKSMSDFKQENLDQMNVVSSTVVGTVDSATTQLPTMRRSRFQQLCFD